jgi:3-phosphoshikimate 1-carboxyvinyltransferase
MKKQVVPSEYSGTVRVPSSKSDGQRAVLAAALAKGISVLTNVGQSADEQAMLEAVQMLGANVTTSGEHTMSVEGMAAFPSEMSLNLGESGLGARLMAAVLAAHAGNFILDGSGSLKERPMDFWVDNLPKLGAGCMAAKGKLPLVISGPMKGGAAEIDGSLSSQFLSGLLMALPLVTTESRLQVRGLNSTPYVQMTLDTLAKFGISVSHHAYEQFVIPGNQHYLSTDYTVEGDWSAASYWLVAAALGQEIVVTGLSLASLQADKHLLKVFEQAQCILEFRGNGMHVNGENRMPFETDATHCPDLFPALACLAAFTPGVSKIDGLSRLKHKESNRGLTLQSEFGKLGVEIVLDGNTMYIHGQTHVNGGSVFSHNDHRIAMCLAIAGMFAESAVEIDGAEAVAKSYPAFWDDLDSLELNDFED